MIDLNGLLAARRLSEADADHHMGLSARELIRCALAASEWGGRDGDSRWIPQAEKYIWDVARNVFRAAAKHYEAKSKVFSDKSQFSAVLLVLDVFEAMALDVLFLEHGHYYSTLLIKVGPARWTGEAILYFAIDEPPFGWHNIGEAVRKVAPQVGFEKNTFIY